MDDANHEEEEMRRNKRRKVAFQLAAITHVVTGEFQQCLLDDSTIIDHRLLPRNEKTVYDHERASYCIRSDYLGSIPRFDGKEFQVMFRLSRSRFQRLMEDVGNAHIPFYESKLDGTGRTGATYEAKLLLPIKSMAYGVPSHCFRDYFQMSKTLAKKCCYVFWDTVVQLYQFEYLRMPTKEDLKNIVRLHEVVHGVPGMFGSLDCMHTWWKNCPVGWKGSFKGKEKHSTIVLEGCCDHHLWLWHAAYGFAGTLNDINILNLSPLVDRILDGTFQDLEVDCVPYKIEEEEFKELYILVDGIYPRRNRFVKAVKEPIGVNQQRFTKWQESVRKDIERAFGVLQFRWQCVSRPIFLMNLAHVRQMVTAAIILHNMGVSDRVMGDVRARYNPAAKLEKDTTNPGNLSQPRDLRRRQKTPTEEDDSVIHADRNREVIELVARTSRWLTPTDQEAIERFDQFNSKDEYHRLQDVLIVNRGKSSRD